MTLHSSLKSASVEARHRNVLKRHERIHALQEGGGLENRKSAFRLPKLKLIKLKVKKVKSTKEGEGQVEGQAAQVSPAATQVAPKPSAEKPKAKEKS